LSILKREQGRYRFSTDSYVVRPLLPGGNIGDLAVNGTGNDLAMCGARPIALSAAFVLEEGLHVSELEAAVASMRNAARVERVSIVAGNTKVVERGKGNGLFITTSGIGLVEHGEIAPRRMQSGDAVIVSGGRLDGHRRDGDRHRPSPSAPPASCSGWIRCMSPTKGASSRS
jgi:hydrogenase expression/formation protein HypE